MVSAGTVARLPAGHLGLPTWVGPLALLVSGLAVGALFSEALRPAGPGADASGGPGLAGQLAQLNATVANLSAALEQARSAAELAQVAACQAGVSEVTTRLGQVQDLLAQGRKYDAFEPLRGLVSASGNTSWAPLLKTDAARVFAGGNELYDRLSFGTFEEANASLVKLGQDVRALAALFQGLYLPFHGLDPVGPRVEMQANISGFVTLDRTGSPVRNPTLPLAAGARMLIEVTNVDVLNHSLAVPSLRLISPLALPGQTVGLVVGPAPAGTYRYYCDVPGHEASMSGMLEVAA